MRSGSRYLKWERDYARGNFTVLFLLGIMVLTSIQLQLTGHFPHQLEWGSSDLFHRLCQEPLVYYHHIKL